MMHPLHLLLLLLVSWLPGLAAAQEAPYGFQVDVQGARNVTLAVAAPLTPRGDPNGVTGRLRDTIERDLNLTGWFEIVEKAAHVDRGGVEPGTFSFDDWKLIRVAALVKLRVWPGTGDATCAAGNVCLDAFVYDVTTGDRLMAKRFSAPVADATAVAHQAANAILFALVGEEGFFDATLVAVNERSGNKEIWLVDITGENARPLTRNGSINLSPAWSPDRRSVAWTSWRRGEPDLYVKDLVSGAVRVLSARPGLEVSAAYSPDGKLVAVARSVGAETDIWLIDAQTGKDVRRLTTGGGIDISPHFSPDGKWIVFASERSGGSQIYIVSTEGGEPRRVTPRAGFFTDPVFSPDGTRIAYVSRGANFDVLTIGVDGTHEVRITQDMGDNEDPTWSPDGRYLVFSSTRGGKGSRLFLSTANGKHQVPITETGGWSQPAWTR